MGNSYGNEEKLSDLLKRLNLEKRMTTNIADTESINAQSIDYVGVDKILQIQREITKVYLRENMDVLKEW